MKLLLDKSEAASALSISESTLGRLVREKKIREIKQGTRCLYRPADLEEFVERLANGDFEKKSEGAADW
ncbi:helix-turn-helix domain-containing protein [Methylomonas koyamae]|uniref:Helix-turn-helix domain-containing protein n=1 Tax=Methylomonas koyamae TaxID=702114 RepID=A0AA91DB35_9GAMM|nr:helix-turn-helix domain-containing protein [Methylomonas koyamae]OAI24567.1 hypothetical protein A1356_15520 [Methylomonas koyamae]